MHTKIGKKTFEVKQTGNRFYYWSQLAERWLPVAKAKVIFPPSRDISKITDALLAEACGMADSDQALALLQDAAGLDGDMAGVFFSQMDIRQDWPDLATDRRLATLRDYVKFEADRDR